MSHDARTLRQTLHEAWADSYPLGSWGGYGSGYWREQPRRYRALTHVMVRIRRQHERIKALRVLIRPDEGCDYRGRGARTRAAFLLLLPIVWNGSAYEPRDGKKTRYFDEVTSWDGHTYAGYEQDCWEATFIATGPWSLARIYRDGGP